MNEQKILKDSNLKISILIPCYNEEKMVERCILSCLDQSRPADQFIIVNDSSTDRTPEILNKYADRITIVKTPRNSGNKSRAQEYGLQFVTGDIMVTTDADTVLDRYFIEKISNDFNDPKVAASGGYVKSMRYNWLTRCRSLDYIIGQNIHKLAQSYINFMFVIPGAAGAFRTDVFRKYATFDHDTITEDLDFTYKFHKQGLRINYNREAVVYTQDPATLYSYANQMRRWFGGGWQNLLKHFDIVNRPAQALELALMYIEGLVTASLLFILPLINIKFELFFVVPYFLVQSVMCVYAMAKEKRWDLWLAIGPYFFTSYINGYIFLEQFIKEVILQKRHLVWFKPERVVT